MADYVSILRRTLDGLGSGATPALRERVYGRAREAVRRQLDGMVPPPAEDVKARQLDQLEAAVGEVEAGYAATETAGEAADGATNEAGAASVSVTAAEPVAGTPAPSAGSGPAPAERSVSTPVAPPAAPAPVEMASPVETAPVVAEPVAPPPPPAEPIARPIEPNARPEPLAVPQATPAPAPTPAPPLPPVDELPPSTAYDTRDVAGPSDGPEILDEDGPVGGRLPDEALPSVAMIGPNGDPVLDPAEAVALGATGAVASFDAAPTADRAPESAAVIAADDRPSGPPPSTLADVDVRPGEPLQPDRLAPVRFDPARPDLAQSGPVVAGAPAFGGGSALAFANRGRPDLPAAADDPAAPALPASGAPAGEFASDPADLPPLPPLPPRDEPSVAMPRTDAPADPFGTPASMPSAEPAPRSDPTLAGTRPVPAPTDADPIVDRTASPVVTAPEGGTEGPASMPPHVTLPPDAPRRGRGGLWAGLLALLLVLGGLLLAREPLADATGVEGFRTAFGIGPVFDRTLDGVRGALVDGDEPVEVATPDPTTLPDDGPAAADPIVIEPTVTPQPGETTAAETSTKVPDRLPSGDDPVDVAPGADDVTVTTVPVETVSPDTPATPGADQVAGLRPDDPTDPVAPPPGAGRAFLVGEPLAGVSDRVEGAVSWSVASESPGRDLPPEPAIRGDVTLADGTVVEVTVRRNADESLPASHLIEIVFALPDGALTVDRLPLVGFKDALGVPARPLVAVPAKITDDFFVVGLNSLASAVESNLALMGSEQFMDVQIVDGNGRRATLTLEKGADGTAVFGEVIDAWNEAPLPG